MDLWTLTGSSCRGLRGRVMAKDWFTPAHKHELRILLDDYSLINLKAKLDTAFMENRISLIFKLEFTTSIFIN